MGFKFRRRIKIAPGIYINVGKSGITSATIGKRGASINVGKTGKKATVGIPGTGISYTSDNLAGDNKLTNKHDAAFNDQTSIVAGLSPDDRGFTHPSLYEKNKKPSIFIKILKCIGYFFLFMMVMGIVGNLVK